MRWTIVLMTVAACNAIFGIKDTKQIDAAYYDAPIDAPFQCPGIGSNLVMSGVLHQEFAQNCLSYSFTPDGFATGLCPADRAGSAYQVFVMATGTVGGGPLGATPGLPDYYTTQGSSFDQWLTAFPSPDATHIYGEHEHHDGATNMNHYEIDRFTRQPDGSWVLTDTPLPSTGFLSAYSTVFTGPTGDRFLGVDVLDAAITEWAQDGSGGWVAGAAHAYRDLGVVSITNPSVTSDGLRMALQGVRIGQQFTEPLYTDRASLSDWFRTVAPLAGGPIAQDIQLTDDCARVYVTGLGSVVSVQQK